MSDSNLTPEQHDAMIKEAHDQGAKIAQIFSGVFFGCLAFWLIVNNGTSLAFVQRAALEKRLTVCCFLSIYVGMFSCFFNFFQVTDIDKFALPSAPSYTIDLSRPIEWVFTCPIMQLSLVLMGGSKIPEYRRYLMPAFSVCILGAGMGSAFMPNLPAKIVFYILGLSLFSTMVFFLRMQIIEYSGGNEGMFTGDSEFRKATMLLIATWFPFPTWFCLSPEGFNIITNVLLIQVGWAFLNIVSKFSFIFYIQRVKDLYCNRLKTRRELIGHKGTTAHLTGRHGSASPPDFDFKGALPAHETVQDYEEAEKERKQEKLGAVVVETMTFLGMAQHTDRFLSLLNRAEVRSVEEVELLTQQDCEELQLPYDLVTALQRRLRVWKLEMVDDAEMGLERGEEHYLKKDLQAPKMMPEHIEVPLGLPPLMGYIPNMVPYSQAQTTTGTPGADHIQSGIVSPEAHDLHPIPNNSGVGIDNSAVEDLMHAVQDKIGEAMHNFSNTIQEALVAVERRLVANMAKQFEATCKTTEQRGELRGFETRVNARVDELARTAEMRHDMLNMERRMNQQIEQHLAMVVTKIDVCCERVEGITHKVDNCSQKVDLCMQKVDRGIVVVTDEQEARQNRMFDELAKRMDNLVAEAVGPVHQNSLGSKEIAQRTEKAVLALEQGLRPRLEEAVAQAVAQGANMGGAQTAHRAQLAVEALESSVQRRLEVLENSVQRRLEDAMVKAMSEGAHQGVSHMVTRTEKVIESSEAARRVELQAVVNNLAERVEDMQASQLRKSAEREERNTRRLEELLELSAGRNLQKVEDVGLELKKEIHGFAKRLNSKIPFM